MFKPKQKKVEEEFEEDEEIEEEQEEETPAIQRKKPVEEPKKSEPLSKEEIADIVAGHLLRASQLLPYLIS